MDNKDNNNTHLTCTPTSWGGWRLPGPPASPPARWRWVPPAPGAPPPPWPRPRRKNRASGGSRRRSGRRSGRRRPARNGFFGFTKGESESCRIFFWGEKPCFFMSICQGRWVRIETKVSPEFPWITPCFLFFLVPINVIAENGSRFLTTFVVWKGVLVALLKSISSIYHKFLYKKTSSKKRHNFWFVFSSGEDVTAVPILARCWM